MANKDIDQGQVQTWEQAMFLVTSFGLESALYRAAHFCIQ